MLKNFIVEENEENKIGIRTDDSRYVRHERVESWRKQKSEARKRLGKVAVFLFNEPVSTQIDRPTFLSFKH